MAKYISLVGTQIMAVLNPLLSIFQYENLVNPDRVELLPTPQTKDVAGRIKEYLISNYGFLPDAVNISPVSYSLESVVYNETEILPPQEVMKALIDPESENIFNLAGGMKFQIPACLNQIDINKLIMVYPESTCIYILQTTAGKSKIFTLPLPENIDVLELQGVTYKRNGGKVNPLLEHALRKYKINPPVSAVYNIEIHSVVFDMVWNDGNVMNFIKIMDYPNLDEIRKLINVSKGRKYFHDLYHRNITVFIKASRGREQVETGTIGKIIIEKKITKSALENAINKKRKLAEKGSNSKSTTESKYSMKVGTPKNADTALVTCVGKAILPTLIALWSHKPKNAYLLYTPDDEDIINTVNILKDPAVCKILPAESVTFHPINFVGTEILDIEKPNVNDISVNITPGTKSQGAFLSIWAKRNNANVYSIRSPYLSGITIDNTKKLSAPDPRQYLQLMGIDVKRGSIGKGNLNIDDRKILEFICKLSKQDRSLGQFPSAKIPIKNKDGNIIYKDTGMNGKITFSNNSQLSFYHSNGEWFERIVGAAVADCGANNIMIRLRLEWSKEIKQRLMKKHGSSVFKTDIDVVARFGSQYYVISCKATKKKSVPKLSNEVASMAKVFGRLTIPMLCFLKYSGEPDVIDDGVTVFGYKTLCNIEEMKNLLKEAVTKKRTTKS